MRDEPPDRRVRVLVDADCRVRVRVRCGGCAMSGAELDLDALAIPSCPGYSATSDGRILSTASNWRGYGVRALVPREHKGYLRVRVKLSGRTVNRQVHRLVTEAFNGPPAVDQQACHLNGDAHDNRASNLRWGTATQNAADRELHGTTARGESNGYSFLTTAEVVQIRALYSDGWTQDALAEQFDINQRTVSRIVRRERWGHVA